MKENFIAVSKQAAFLMIKSIYSPDEYQSLRIPLI